MTRATAATPACLLGMLLRMAYKAKKYHSGTMCAGVVSGLAWIELSGWPRAIGVPKATRATPMAHTTQPTRPRRGPMLMRGYCQSENKPGFDECRDAGTRAGIEGGIRRPHQKEGENIASSEKAGKVHKGITDSERQQGTNPRHRELFHLGATPEWGAAQRVLSPPARPALTSLRLATPLTAMQVQEAHPRLGPTQVMTITRTVRPEGPNWFRERFGVQSRMNPYWPPHSLGHILDG